MAETGQRPRIGHRFEVHVQYASRREGGAGDVEAWRSGSHDHSLE
jgi:hypothetical protein